MPSHGEGFTCVSSRGLMWHRSTYCGVGGGGKYNQVTMMDGTSGACSSSPFAYSGTLAPMNEDV